MKFSVIIQLNAWQDWYEYYIAYDSLKKWLYLVEKAKLGFITLPDSYRNVDPDVFIKLGNRNYNSPRLTPINRPATPTTERTPLLAASSKRPQTKFSLFRRQSVSKTDEEDSDEDGEMSANREGATSGASRYSAIPSPALPPPQPGNAAGSPTMPGNKKTQLESFFVEPLDDQLEKIVMFYSAKKREFEQRIEDLLHNIALVEGYDLPGANGATGSHVYGAGDVEGLTDSDSQMLNTATSSSSSAYSRHIPGKKPSNRSLTISTYSGEANSSWGVGNATFATPATYNFWNRPGNKMQRQSFRKQCSSIYVELKELQEYVLMNYSGFSKILKKYEKVTGFRLKTRYMQVVDSAFLFRPEEAATLKEALDHLVEVYARICTENDLRNAKIELESKCRQRVSIERNTVWKDMVEAGGRTMSIIEARRKPDVDENVPSWWLSRLFSPRIVVFLILLGIFYALLVFPIFETEEQQNCFAIFVFASGMWAFEIVPLFVTSAAVPLLVVILKVMREVIILPDGTRTYLRLDAKGQAKRVFAEMFSPVIMLLLGGFSLGSAVSKHGIAKLLASFVLDKAGSSPKIVILANMFVSTFSSMWISNVAAPALCFPLISPILRNIPTSSTYAKALIMGIALAANVGGMASPISSPQNIIAMGMMNPTATWAEWFIVALPVCVVIDLSIWGILLLVYNPQSSSPNGHQIQDSEAGNTLLAAHTGPSNASRSGLSDENLPRLNQYMTTDPLNSTQWYIIGVTFCTIFLWCIEKNIESVVGDMGIIALLPIIAFYGTGVLSKDDWNQQLWNVVMLAMGGICLGKAVDSSGLLAHVTSLITPYLDGLTAFKCMLAFSLIVLVITSFISHTVGALIILPVVAEIGANMPDPQPRMLVLIIALICSGAMGLPVSSFPNMNAIAQQDAVGVPYIGVVDFHKVGLLSSLVAWVTIVSLGYYATVFLNFK
ncbi:low-affinity phosphate transporter [Entophlyctis sp. JEL0112]|nr:low-affinity phosphate transporter [Entophlyctis sp. JEL0112]